MIGTYKPKQSTTKKSDEVITQKIIDELKENRDYHTFDELIKKGYPLRDTDTSLLVLLRKHPKIEMDEENKRLKYKPIVKVSENRFNIPE